MGRVAGRLAGADDRFAEAAGGTRATPAWKGRPAHDAGAQVAGVCRAVTFPGAGGRPGLVLWAR